MIYLLTHNNQVVAVLEHNASHDMSVLLQEFDAMDNLVDQLLEARDIAFGHLMFGREDEDEDATGKISEFVEWLENKRGFSHIDYSEMEM